MDNSKPQLNTDIYTKVDLKNIHHGNFRYIYNKQTGQASVQPFNPTAELIFGTNLYRRNSFCNAIVEIKVQDPVTGDLGPLQIQTPLMNTQFGLSSGMMMNKGPVDKKQRVTENVELDFWDLQRLSNPNQANNPRLGELYDFFTSLALIDQLVVEKAKKNIKNWFPGDISLHSRPDGIDFLYRPITKLKVAKSGKHAGEPFAPSIRAKAEKTRGGYTFCVFDNETHEQLPADAIIPKSQLVAVLECTGIWFREKEFGVGWKLVQVVLDQPVGPSIQQFAIATNTVYAQQQQHPDVDMNAAVGHGYQVHGGNSNTRPRSPTPIREREQQLSATPAPTASTPGFVSEQPPTPQVKPQYNFSLPKATHDSMSAQTVKLTGMK